MSASWSDLSLYESPSSSSSIPSHQRQTGHRFNPYAKPSSTVSSSHSNTVTRRGRKSFVPTPIAVAATGVAIYKNKNSKVMKNPHEEYAEFCPFRVLYEDPTLPTHNKGKKQFWYFILGLLMDPSKREAIQWTGRGREFAILSLPIVNTLWSTEQGLLSTLKPDSILRNLRACYKRKVMIRVGMKTNRYAFHTEPSLHVGMTRDELTNFVTQSNSTSPFMEADRGMIPAASIFPTPAPSTAGSEDSFMPCPSTVPSTVSSTAYPEMDSSSNTVSQPFLPEISSFFNPSHCAFPYTEFPRCSYWSPLPLLPSSFSPSCEFQTVHESNPIIGDYFHL